jgi:hypothetical protein
LCDALGGSVAEVALKWAGRSGWRGRSWGRRARCKLDMIGEGLCCTWVVRLRMMTQGARRVSCAIEAQARRRARVDVRRIVRVLGRCQAIESMMVLGRKCQRWNWARGKRAM